MESLALLVVVFINIFSIHRQWLPGAAPTARRCGILCKVPNFDFQFYLYIRNVHASKKEKYVRGKIWLKLMSQQEQQMAVEA